jgi:predicted RNA methylase
MTFGHLDTRQRSVVATIIANRTVHDFGAGDMNLSAELADLGAKRVIAIEAEFPSIVRLDASTSGSTRGPRAFTRSRRLST